MAVSEDLKVMDCGHFERMLEDLRKGERDESVVDQLATAKILSDFAKRICSKTKKGTQKASSSGKRRHAKTTTEDPTCTRLLGKQRKRNIAKRLDNIQPKQPVNFAEMGLDPPPNLPANARNYIESKGEVKDLTLVIMKPLFGTDLCLQQARLSIPFSQILGDFLGQEDKVKLDNEAAINVTLIPPCLNEELPMFLKKYNQLGTYRLIRGWNSVLRNEQNALKEHNIVQLWSFRRQEQLFFVLVKVRDGVVRDN